MAQMMKLEIRTDNSQEVLRAAKEQLLIALNAIGQEAEGYAKEKSLVDTGRLRNSITFTVVDDEISLYVGTNVEYAPYVELGTGIYADDGAGRKTPWYYYSEKLGRYVLTRGIKPTHFLRDALANHAEHYKAILEAALKS